MAGASTFGLRRLGRGRLCAGDAYRPLRDSDRPYAGAFGRFGLARRRQCFAHADGGADRAAGDRAAPDAEHSHQRVGTCRERKAYVTLAAVDEGILQLTDFKSPDPDTYYFGKRRLGVGMRDDYGRLIKAEKAPLSPGDSHRRRLRRTAAGRELPAARRWRCFRGQ